MAVLRRPFAYNTTGPILGTDQVGDLAIGYPTNGFDSTPGVQWWIGPSEATGYVIAKPIVLGNQPTQVTEDALYMDPLLKATDVVLSNNNQTATQTFGYSQSVLGANVPITVSDSTMFSVRYNSTGNTSLGNRFIGVGTSAMNYAGPFDGYPGNDTRSYGFSAEGKLYFNGSAVSTSLTPWNDGDVIDIALTLNPGQEKIWVRVNGGNWNNSNTENPNDPAGSGFAIAGLDNLLAVLCPGISECEMTVLNYPPYGVPGGYNFLGNVSASVGFNRSSALTEPSFIEIAETLTGQTFASGAAAKSYLNTNGYWTSWV